MQDRLHEIEREIAGMMDGAHPLTRQALLRAAHQLRMAAEEEAHQQALAHTRSEIEALRRRAA